MLASSYWLTDWKWELPCPSSTWVWTSSGVSLFSPLVCFFSERVPNSESVSFSLISAIKKWVQKWVWFVAVRVETVEPSTHLIFVRFPYCLKRCLLIWVFLLEVFLWILFLNCTSFLFVSSPRKPLNPNVPHAPKRPVSLTKEEFVRAVQNALRYFPEKYHAILGPEFAEELKTYGHIYMYR